VCSPRETFKAGEAFARESWYAPESVSRFDRTQPCHRAEPWQASIRFSSPKSTAPR
jgi:hypothetical protein